MTVKPEEQDLDHLDVLLQALTAFPREKIEPLAEYLPR